MDRRIKYSILTVLWALWILACAVAGIGVVIMVLDPAKEWKTIGFYFMLGGFLASGVISLFMDGVKRK